MSTKANKIDGSDDQEDYGTSHYLGQLNQLYSKHNQSITVPWEEMDDELKYELVVKALFIIKELDDSPVDEVKENLRSVFDRDMKFVGSSFRFMEEQDLISVKEGKIHLTKTAREILK